MKRRITLIHRPEDGVDPTSVRIEKGAISGPEIRAAREERLTFIPDELPEDVLALLGRCGGRLHVRWATSSSYEAPELLSSRISPGLHVSYTPLGNSKDEPTCLCPSLELFFGDLGCKDADSFVRVPSGGDDANDIVFQYYQPYNDLAPLIKSLEATLCQSTADDECASCVHWLHSAASVDASYDSESETLRLQALWPSDAHAVATGASGHRTEVGVFATDPSAGDAYELGVRGILAATPDEKKEPSVLAFSVPSRHRSADASFSAEFLAPQGLHPTLQLAISSAAPPPEYRDQGACSPYVYLTLPRTIFADRYQLADDLFLASKNLSSLRFASQPVDLEMPEYKTPTWGSTVLLELAPPETSTDGPWTAEIPLHLRYMAPAEGGYSDAQVPYPAVFWACEAGAKTGGQAGFAGNPWDRAALGYDAHFGRTTGFWHVEPRPASEGVDLTVTARVPVLATEKASWVEAGTAAAVLAGFAWVLFALLSAAGKSGLGGKAVRAKKEQ